MFGNTNKELEKVFEQPTDSNPLEHVVSSIDDADYKFFDNGMSYSHKDFSTDNVKNNSCIYLDIEYDEWQGHQDGYKKGELTIMLSKVDAIAIARKFNLTSLDLSN